MLTEIKNGSCVATVESESREADAIWKLVKMMGRRSQAKGHVQTNGVFWFIDEEKA